MKITNLKVKNIKTKQIVKKAAVAKGGVLAARKKAKSIFEKAKKKYMKEFEKHNVTKEIGRGVGANNASGTLAGYGNLFTFIGFNRNNVNPIDILRGVLSSGFKFKDGKSSKSDPTRRDYIFSYPGKEYLESKRSLKMPWESGRTWILGIERGISGFSHYMYKKWAKGRSGMGIQVKYKISKGRASASFKPVPYRTIFEKSFLDEIKRVGKKA